MKKLLFIALLVALLGASAFAQSIRVTQPNTTVTWPLRSTHNITWDYSGISGTVKILLFRGETGVGIIATGLPIANRSYSWQVGQTTTGFAAQGSGYRIKVRVMAQPYHDFSDAPFTIGSQYTLNPGTMEALHNPPQVFTPPVKVTYPNGGERLRKGVVNEIRWESTDEFGKPRIKIKKGGRVVKTYEPNQVYPIRRGNASTWSWVIPTSLEPGNDYKVRLENTVGRLRDESNANFTIAEDTLIEVTAPRGGYWSMGDRRHITWRAAGTGNLDIILRPTVGGGSGYMIKSNVSPTPSRFFWTVGNFEHASVSLIPPDGVKYKVVIRDRDSSTEGESPEFTVHRPSVTVLEPVGGTVHRGDHKTIRWRTGPGFVGNVDVELYIVDGGSFRRFDQLRTNVRDLGSVSWHVYPNPGIGEAELDAPPTPRQYFIRIVSSRCRTVFGDGAQFTLER